MPACSRKIGRGQQRVRLGGQRPGRDPVPGAVMTASHLPGPAVAAGCRSSLVMVPGSMG